ncbi:xin actin-binding repeat-containing protein 1 isoform X1 [Anguilla anguilla]|uniref:xin actin-binding repeat-containing protein 1 isoform X1 n=1 Tax=Anguilla anguilla TaxID=7936 RepID=UPI0015B04081|nr:xin actin-binding repeat-containing protein 1 isoform X1 [Anguilla anguilla]XP_035284602.1 xin actin-binding repeat-containing protein 1 isoform X1 [Anguilla anguilla]
MEMRTTMRRAQSLKNLSTGHNEWWGATGTGIGTGRWDRRKSVSQLVEQYQSSLELRSIGTEEHKQKFTPPKDPKSTGSKVDTLLRRYESREWARQSARDGGGPVLSRSRSMDYLPPHKPTGTEAMRALFESKAALQHNFSSTPWLNPNPNTNNRLLTVGGTRGTKKQTQSAPPTPARKETTHQRVNTVQQERRKTISGVSVTPDKTPSLPNGKNRPSQPDLRGKSAITQLERSSSVKARSAFFLSKAAAADSTVSPIKQGGVIQDSPISSGKKAKPSKMADKTQHIKVSHGPGEEDELPPPPPPLPRPHLEGSPATGDQGQSSLPIPPPKETFSSFYQQRQKSELKRLFKHIHPELGKKMENVVDEELVEVLNSENAQSAADAGYQAEVQSMKWIFENWTLDNIGDPHTTKKLLEEEGLQVGDVRGASSMFEHRELDSAQFSTSTSRRGQVKGDVHTATWLFETQPLDSLNKITPEEGELVEAVLKEPIPRGDVRGARLLFESKPLDALGRCNSIEDHSFLKLKSEIQEQKGDIQKTIKLFQAEPCCALQDSRGNIHEIKSICREEIQTSNVRTARWLFETQPLDVINKDMSGVKIIRGISLEEAQKGGVDCKRWMFETQTLDAIHESIQEDQFKGTVEVVEAADVGSKRQLFETQPLDALKGESSGEAQSKEEIIGGNVRSSLWLFETQPMETLKENYEVGRLQKVTVSEDEKGMVKNKKHTFETCTLDTINKEEAEGESKSETQEILRGDVKVYKNLFETIPLGTISHPENVQVENPYDITAGDVKGNRTLFESTPLYTIKDWSGNFHKVTTVSREESINGNVQNYKWMFETRPLDQFDDGKENVEVIRGITRQEEQAGDVKTAKWLFETQPLDCIHSKVDLAEQHSSVQRKESQGGDVKTCKWLFETQPMDILYEKSEKKSEEEIIPKSDVKSHTWLFETQPLDSIKDGEEHHLKLCSTFQDENKSDVNVKTVKHLFETETLDSLSMTADADQDVRYVSKVDVRSGDVSRVKEIFESKSLDEIGLSSVNVSEAEDQGDNIQAGSVHKFTWLFENNPIDSLKDQEDGTTSKCTVDDVEGGDVGSKKFIFETFSLDKIQDKDKLLEHSSVCVEQPVSTSNVNVKSSTMLFESQPLYAIRDKDGQFHEVTTVKKEEVMSGDVRGARWMFETKPLDTIKPQEEIFVIRAVTQEDVLKGDVKSARWRFETQPLDSLMSRETPVVKTVEDIQKGDVQLNKQHFESQATAKNKYVRMVSVTDVQQGDVRTSTWLFENQPIDSLKGELLETTPVHREDIQKGDVKRSTWLFETQPLDTIKEADPTVDSTVQEELPQADVKSTTWLFESTPLDKISFQCKEQSVICESVKETLCHLSAFNAIHSHGIVIEANESRSVKMAKYHYTSSEGAQIQKEEIVEGNIKNIMLQLLYRTNLAPQVMLLKEDEKGHVKATKLEMPTQQTASSAKQDKESKMESVAQVIESILSQDMSLKKGIVIQETESGYAEMTIYSLYVHTENTEESSEVIKGDVKSTIGTLLATAQDQRTLASFQPEQSEKGNVNLYRSCIEKGDLQYLKSLQVEPSEDELDSAPKDQIEIVQGDVKEAKRNLNQLKDQVERTVLDVVPGDVKNAKKVFSEGSIDQSICVQKEEIVPGDVFSAKQSLGQVINQPFVVEKEEIVSGDVKATMQSLEKAKQQSMRVEREVISPGTIYDLDVTSHETSAEETNKAQQHVTVTKEEIVSGDVKAAKKSLERARKYSNHVEREVVVPGKIYDLNVRSQEESSLTEGQQRTQTEEASCEKLEMGKSCQEKSTEVRPNEQRPNLQAATQNLCQTSRGVKVIRQETQEKQHIVVQGKQQVVSQEHSTQKKQVVSQKTTGAQQARSQQTSVQFTQKKATTHASTSKQSTSSSRSQQVTSANQKVSDSEKTQGTDEKCEGFQKSEVASGADINVKSGDMQPAFSLVNPVVKSESDSQSSEAQTEAEIVVRGDVKAAIRSLQSASTEHRLVEKEDIVRGNMQAALDSLEKSSVNVSRGDFKAAMIYRNAGQKKKKSSDNVCKQADVKSVCPCDTELSPSVSVTYGEQPATPALNLTPVADSCPDDISEKLPISSALTSKPKSPPPLPAKACEKPVAQRPALPPKPHRSKTTSDDVTGCAPVSPNMPEQLRESQQTPVIPPKARRLGRPLSPPPLPAKPASNQELSKDLPQDATESKHIPVNCDQAQKHHFGNIIGKKEHQPIKKETIQNTETSNLSTKQLKKEAKCTEAKTDRQEEYINNYSSTPTCAEVEREKLKQHQKTHGSEEIHACVDSENGDSSNEIHIDFQAALQNFGGRKKGVVVTNPVLPKKISVVHAEDNNERRQMAKKDTCSRQTYVKDQESLHLDRLKNSSADQKSLSSHSETHTPSTDNSHSNYNNHEVQENKVILREKKTKRETDDERRQRLSVHKDEIMRGNVKAAMEIFENLRKREELKIILSKVEEIEGETSKVDVRSLKNLFENVPAWIVAPGKNANGGKPKGEKNVERTDSMKDYSENTSSMEVVFGDLERASVEIMNLKEQTLARLMDIEEAIKKALYSVSNLKSESDIAGLSGLFNESLRSEQSPATPKNIRKISIVSSRTKTEQGREASGTNAKQTTGLSGKSEEVQKPGLQACTSKPQAVSPSSPCFISIQSAARKPVESPKTQWSHSTATHQGTAERTQHCHSTFEINGNLGQPSAHKESEADVNNALRPKRKVSVLEVQTMPEATGIVGTKTVSEKYEETDCFGNKFVSSKTSTIVTKQSETKTSSTFEVVANPTRYEVMTSPLIRRPVHTFTENPQFTGKEEGRVFVTFGHPKTGKH